MIKNSILLCTFNESKYIKDTVLNIQKFVPDLEIIIVDDASKDDTLSIIQNLQTKCKIKLIDKRQKVWTWIGFKGNFRVRG